MDKQEWFWRWMVDNAWLWLIVSNVFFFLVYILWGVLDVLRVPGR